VVALIPVAFSAPPVLVLIPPPMLLTPATLARFVQFPALVLRLPAVTPVSLNGLMQFMLSVFNSTLAAVYVVRVNPWHCGKEQCCSQDGAGDKGHSCGGKLWSTIHGDCASQGKDVEKRFAPTKWTEKGVRFSAS